MRHMTSEQYDFNKAAQNTEGDERKERCNDSEFGREVLKEISKRKEERQMSNPDKLNEAAGRPANCDNLRHIENIAEQDCKTLHEKGKTYGDSWKSRGGVGAFMMLARKMDRLENIAERSGYDIFKAIAFDPKEGGIMDDIRDLRAYLILVESEMIERNTIPYLTAPTQSGDEVCETADSLLEQEIQGLGV